LESTIIPTGQLFPVLSPNLTLYLNNLYSNMTNSFAKQILIWRPAESLYSLGKYLQNFEYNELLTKAAVYKYMQKFT